jgi:hypothetical protein
MDFKKNIAFTSLIKINGRLREFNFRKRGSSYYDGDTSDERGNRLFFKMEKEEGSWKINHTGLPAWLVENEPLVIGIIEKEEQQIFTSYCIPGRSFLRKYF